MAKAVRGSGPSVLRLKGALANGVVVAASTTAKERVYIGESRQVTVRHKLSAVTLTPELTVHAMLEDAQDDDTKGTRAATGASAAIVMGTAEVQTDFTPGGERYVEIEVESIAGENATIDFIEVNTLRA